MDLGLDIINGVEGLSLVYINGYDHVYIYIPTMVW
jgi:hypothetical protein